MRRVTALTLVMRIVIKIRAASSTGFTAADRHGSHAQLGFAGQISTTG
jgi:hypothetical protein